MKATDDEIASIKLVPLSDADRLDFYEPQAADDYRAVREKIEKQNPLKVHHKDVENLFEQNVIPDPSSLWVLVKIPPIATDSAFAPRPEKIKMEIR